MSDPAPIHLFVPSFDVEACLRGVRECLERGWTGLGGKTVDIEQAWSVYTGLPHAHFLNSATSGLELALTLLGKQRGWAPGDEVITTPLTFVSTNHAILRTGYAPVFADVSPDGLCLDPASVEARIGSRTRAVMFVGLGGNTAGLLTIAEVCARRGLALILDAAHMAGTRWRGSGKHVGAEADVTVFSFQAVKNMPTGDAGMICFADPELDVAVRKWSWLGISKDTYHRTLEPGTYKWDYDVEYVGGKHHGNAVAAAIALAQLPLLDRDNAYRRMLADRYDRLGVRRVVEPVAHDAKCESARHLYQIRTHGHDRNAVMMFLNALNIFVGVHYKSNVQYSMYRHSRGADDVPVAALASDTIISLPLHMRMTVNDVDRVVDAVERAVQ